MADVLRGPLTSIFIKFLQEGVVPADWKLANVTPIFKKGSKSVPGNYRPVSLTCVICKVMEALVKDDIVEHLAKNSLIWSSQHGFTAGNAFFDRNFVNSAPIGRYEPMFVIGPHKQ